MADSGNPTRYIWCSRLYAVNILQLFVECIKKTLLTGPDAYVVLGFKESPPVYKKSVEGTSEAPHRGKEQQGTFAWLNDEDF